MDWNGFPDRSPPLFCDREEVNLFHLAPAGKISTGSNTIIVSRGIFYTERDLSPRSLQTCRYRKRGKRITRGLSFLWE